MYAGKAVRRRYFETKARLCRFERKIPMLEQVENKIKEFSNEQKEEYYRKKDADLLAWGLSGKSGKGKKNVPLIVTDEEYEALIDAATAAGRTSRNPVANMLNIVSVVIVALGIIVGFVLNSFAESLGVVYLSASIVCGLLIALLFRGVGEAIKILQQLLDMRLSENAKRARRRAAKQFPDTQPDTSERIYAQPSRNYSPYNK